MTKLLTFLPLVFFLLIEINANAQKTAAEVSDTTTAGQKKEKGKSPFKDYKKVITEEAITDDGLFKVHLVDEKLLYEIPNKLLGKEMLLISRIARTPANLSPFLNAGSKVGEQVIRWERKRNQVLLKVVSYSNIADKESPIHQSVVRNNFEPIIETFKVEALNEDTSGVVIDVTKLFTKDVKALSGLSSGIRRQYKVSRLEGSRSMIDTARSFPINVEVIHTMTYGAGEPPSNSKAQTISMQMNQSMILLPEEPMQPRIFDPRVGWFTISQIDYDSKALKSDQKRYIRRWKLEPKDPAAYARGELVEPVKPIIYYLDPATPEKWRPYFRQGIEDWNTAFEVAGFKNAIIARDAPSPEEDPEFSPEDARYSVVRYVASTTRNAIGPSVSDPRTGEILESDIIWYHNHLRSYRNRYLIETGAANPQARSLQTPEEQIGEMMRRVISHEIGHALGLPHNMKASAAYPVDSLRSGPFTQEYGIATTIMDYARYNYVAQPGDENIRFIRQLGPYDLYSINWGYRYLGEVGPEAELADLRSWIKDKEGDPVYMFGSGRGGLDPDSQTECVGDDNIAASAYGIQNLRRVVPNLIDWTTTEGEDYAELNEVYGELLGVWSRYIGHVITNVGGVHETLKTSDQEGVVYEPVAAATQREAMRFLMEEAFATPDWLLDPGILQRIQPAGAVDRIRNLQERFLNRVLDMGRMQRMIENESFNGPASYPLLTMLRTLRQGIWQEINLKQPIAVGRRNLQRAYLERMDYLLKKEQTPIPPRFREFVTRTNVKVSQSDIRAVVKAELKVLYYEIKKTAARLPDAMSKYHLEDCMDRIMKMLEKDEMD